MAALTERPICYSLILATYGRCETVDRLLATLAAQTYSMGAVEIIIVDQNRDGKLNDIVERWQTRLNITHILSPVMGLALNRNIGLNAARGEIVAFPDDDCEYPTATLEFVDRAFATHGVDFLLGNIWDNEKKVQAIRAWPADEIAVNAHNFYRLTSSITMFTRYRNLRFDERFGLGAQYGSNEDAIYVLSHLTAGKRGRYLPGLTIHHEHQSADNLGLDKVASYAAGFGHFVREYLSAPTAVIFLLSVGFQALGWLCALVKRDKRAMRMRAISLKHRCLGLLDKKTTPAPSTARHK